MTHCVMLNLFQHLNKISESQHPEVEDPELDSGHGSG
jgi:hypothetical protein